MGLEIVYERTRNYRTTHDYIIRVEMTLSEWKDEKAPTEFPDGYKFRWIVYNLENKDEFIRFDNHRGKGPHWHEDDKWEFFEWISLDETEKLFYQKIEKKFGYLIKYTN